MAYLLLVKTEQLLRSCTLMVVMLSCVQALGIYITLEKTKVLSSCF